MKNIILGISLLFNTYLFSQCVDTVWIPSAFNPYGVNSTFYPVTPNGNNWEMMIFNRQGNLIFNSQNQPWDGNSNGKQCPSGAYVYVIRVYGDNCRRQLTGTITLLN
jgi:gliding motility-associated-like protein